MFQNTYYIAKSSGTFADNLAAFGRGFVLSRIAEGNAKVQIEDGGNCFLLNCTAPMKEEWVKRRHFFVGAPMLITFDKKTDKLSLKGTNLAVDALAGMSDVAYSYEQGKIDNAAYWDWRRNLSAEQKKLFAQKNLLPPVEPPSDWELFRAVNPGALQAYNGALADWYNTQSVFADFLCMVLSYSAQLPNDEIGASKYWEAVCKREGLEKPSAATASQLLNPAQGKGTNMPKATFSAPSNLKNFWLLELLKWQGLHQGGITRLISGTKDRKTFVLTPKRLDWDRHVAVMKKFKASMAGGAGAIQLDVLSALRYTKAMLEHAEEAMSHDPFLELLDANEGVSNFVSGMNNAFYKNLGNSVATMNIATIGLPRWVRPRMPSDLALLKEAIDEHITIARNLDESRGDQFDLLRQYRDFLSADDLSAFFSFSNAYAGFIIQQRERDKFAPQFSVKNLEIFMLNTQPNLSKITQSQGFKNLAYAIRMATVEAQRRSLKKNAGKYPVLYEKRYGLGQELTRKAAYRAEFVKALSEFVLSYNSENARVRDRLDKQEKPNTKGLRNDIHTDDLNELFALMDEFGDSHMIASLLVAYGYASNYQRSEEKPKVDPDDDLLPNQSADDDQTLGDDD